MPLPGTQGFFGDENPNRGQAGSDNPQSTSATVGAGLVFGVIGVNAFS